MRLRANWSKKAMLAVGLVLALSALLAQETGKRSSSYSPVVIQEDFPSVMSRISAAKPAIMQRQKALLEERYDLSDRPAAGVTMSRGKAVQAGVRGKLRGGMTWDRLAQMIPEDVRDKDVFPLGFTPLPHPNHGEGGMLFPMYLIDEIQKQENRELARFDLDFDLPDHIMPEFPPAIYLTTRPDLGDVSQGKLATIDNYYELFNGILNPKQLEGLRLLVPAAAVQSDRGPPYRTPEPRRRLFRLPRERHTNGATHLVGDIRPQEFRHRIETPSLRGVNIQRLFGSQRALKTVEDFTEFEPRAAYFDGDPVIAAKKGVNTLDRSSQVHPMAELQELLDFPPAPKLGWDGKLDPTKASPAELRGQEVFFGKGQCASCHAAPYFTDNSMHDLHAERFYKQHMENGMMMAHDGPIKTFPLRGIKDTPPYLHDGRLLTLDDTVEYFNLVLGVRLTDQEKKDLVAFMRAL